MYCSGTFTVLLVLELAIETQVDAFTIRRAPETTQLPDLLQAENSVLAVRNDLRRNANVFDRTTTITQPIETTAKTEEIQKNVITTTKATAKSAPTTTIPSTTTSTSTTLTTTSAPPGTTRDIIPTTTKATTTRTVTTSISTSIEPSTEEPAESPEPSTETTSEQTSVVSSSILSSSTTESMVESTSEDQIQASAEINLVNQTSSSATLLNVTVPDMNKTADNSMTAEDSTTVDNYYRKNYVATNTEKSTTTSKSTIVANSTTVADNATAANSTTADNSTSPNNSIIPENSTTVDNSTNVADKNVTIVTTPTASTTDAESASTSSSQNFSTTEEWRTDEDNNTSYSTESVDMISSSVSTTDTSSSKDIDGSSQNGTTSTARMPQPTTMSESATNVSEVTTVVEEEVVPTEEAKQTNAPITPDGLKTDSSAVTATPYWKRYTLIDRKRITTVADAVTSTETDDLVQAGTAQSSVSLEKALNISSDIPSLEELKNELLALDKMTTVSLDKLSSTVTDEITSTSTESFSSTEETSTMSSETDTTSDMTTRFDIVSSKRAGFLDHSSRATLATEKATTTSQRSVGTSETLVTDKRIPENKTTPLLAQKSSSMASQSQLAEDAINEELMKEEILSDTVEYTQRQRDVIDSSKTPPMQSAESNQDSSSEDKLSVKPISAERVKNGGLYTVSPNYKPLKKIEVQPPKPFVRNPDDNSWRIEGLNSLGIVVKVNNNTSSKPFTQVLKNKTESELNLLEKFNKGEEPELRERLEKIAEKRKSKKKKINQYGETVYTDYSDSGEKMTSVSPGYFADLMTAKDVDFTTTTLPELDYNKQTTTPAIEMDDELETTTLKTKKVIDEYESDDSDEPDYTLPNIDLKKYITPAKSRDTPPPAPATYTPPPTLRTFLPDRRPTIQYFPPREKQKVVVNDYDTDFQRKINAYTYKDVPSRVTQTTPATASQPAYQFPRNKYEQHRPNDIARRPPDLGKSVYLTQPPAGDHSGFNMVDPEVNRATYVIKHLRDFLDEAVKADDGAAATDEPLRGVTANARVPPAPPGDYYDYEAQFRKDVLDKFVENFNQNSERFKADFPVLYNTSVVHSQLAAEGRGASSTAFMKRLYEDAQAIQRAGRLPKRFDPLCERTVELSPAYELHYYVPEEEEKEQAEPRHPPPPYRLRL
ncbi:uncharacterized protein LOC126367747 [Pectinophora gossypiella]|uniref:uncharacterized protein LOC126367747 n=1 Tax=Pectinophora gossypiella TaxID=13191 RepID=UPI00214F5104|nr:uncharacterized protein LOC126367747 [Pectinophora gossypiella]